MTQSARSDFSFPFTRLALLGVLLSLSFQYPAWAKLRVIEGSDEFMRRQRNVYRVGDSIFRSEQVEIKPIAFPKRYCQLLLLDSESPKGHSLNRNRITLNSPNPLIAALHRDALKASSSEELLQTRAVLADALLEQNLPYGSALSSFFKSSSIPSRKRAKTHDQIHESFFWELKKSTLPWPETNELGFGADIELNIDANLLVNGLNFYSEETLRKFMKNGGTKIYQTWGFKHVGVFANLLRSGALKTLANSVPIKSLDLGEHSIPEAEELLQFLKLPQIQKSLQEITLPIFVFDTFEEFERINLVDSIREIPNLKILNVSVSREFPGEGRNLRTIIKKSLPKIKVSFVSPKESQDSKRSY